MIIYVQDKNGMHYLTIFFIYLFYFLKLPTIIADNAGYDSADLVSQLRAAHSEGKMTYGLGMLKPPE